MSQQITIVDYGMGNLHSVRRKLERVGARAIITADPDLVAKADKLVLPGVGHFGQAMDNLRRLHLVDALHEASRVRQAPTLGICLGMELFGRWSEEGDVEGLGWVEADVVHFRVADPVRHKVPHTGWNGVTVRKDCALLRDLSARAEFYFVHSYYLACDREDLVLCETEYDCLFTSAIACGNLFGVQFHPEKSHDTGELLLRNFAAL
jgi:glutamine amidotransferase